MTAPITLNLTKRLPNWNLGSFIQIREHEALWIQRSEDTNKAMKEFVAVLSDPEKFATMQLIHESWARAESKEDYETLAILQERLYELFKSADTSQIEETTHVNTRKRIVHSA